MHRLLIFFSVLLIQACTNTNHETQSLTALAVAHLDDSFQRTGRRSGNFYYAHSIDSVKIHNAMDATYKESSSSSGSNGVYVDVFNLQIMGASRELTPETKRIQLRADPLHLWINRPNLIHVEGIVEFTPEVGEHYLVNGSISPTHAAVWLSLIHI